MFNAKVKWGAVGDSCGKNLGHLLNMFILKKEHLLGVYVPFRALFLAKRYFCLLSIKTYVGDNCGLSLGLHCLPKPIFLKTYNDFCKSPVIREPAFGILLCKHIAQTFGAPLV